MKSLTAEANPISTSIHEEMNKNNCSIEGHFNFKFIAISLFYICVSGFHQINRINRRYILKKNYCLILVYGIVRTVKANLKSIGKAIRKGRLELSGMS